MLRAMVANDEDLLRALISAHTASLAELQALFGHMQAKRRIVGLCEQIADAEHGEFVPFR